MIKILVKVAAEISVGKDTIVEFLSKKGYEIENKPNAKITDNMYDELVREFKSSIDIKEKADQMIIGTRPVPKKEPLPPLPGLSNINLVKPAVSLTQTPVSTPQPEKVQEPIKTEEVEEVIKAEAPKAQLKILGKIDLSPKKKEEPKKVEPRPEPIVKVEEQPPVEVIKTEPPKNEVELPKVEKTEPEPPKVEVKVQVAENKSDSVNESPETSEKAEDAVIKAEAPQLKGLKILGKINTDKFNKKPVTKPNPPQHQKSDKPSDASSADERSKRKRKRKKVTTDNSAKQQGGGGQQQGSGGNTGGQKHSGENRPNVGARPHDGNRNSDSRRHHQNQQHNRNRPPIAKKEEVKEITKKEIDDQIKATMARLSVGGKSKRQKIRRDKRDVMREKQEQQMHNEGMEKLQITEFISVSELASVLDVSVTEVITTCISLGYMVSINQRLDAEVIEIIANEFGQEVEFISAEEQLSSDEEVDEIDDPKDLKPRAPIVTVMGHVDHGKTSLLDFIRSANVVSGEAGGITQHIGAYEVVHNGKKITFLDTPGHEAFTAMRARGAKITDVAVIIIAADDNVMPQTKEAISHAQAAGVPIVFAINKIDKEGADANRIKQELASMNMLVEEWGGKYQSQDISAKKGLNVDLLLEKILLEAEILDLEANPKRKANGTVIEASLDKGRGYVTKILVQNGTLNIGDPIVAGEYSGKIKAMFNERGTKVNSAGPSSPVLILGLSGAPQAGEKFKEMTSEADARQLASKRAQITREQTTRASKRISLDEIGRRLALGNFKELKIIVKGDVDGSIEALADSLIKLSVAAVQVSVIHKAVGQIVESDVLLASASDAIIIGFQVRPSMNARKLAEKEGVEIKTYSIIYEAINEVKSAMEGMLEPTREEKIIGQIEVRELFKVSKVGTVAGCYVLEGKFTRNTPIRVIRDGIVTYPSKEGMTASLSSLKRFKDDVKEVKSGMECGLTIHNFNDLKLGDIIEGYEITEVKQTL